MWNSFANGGCLYSATAETSTLPHPNLSRGFSADNVVRNVAKKKPQKNIMVVLETLSAVLFGFIVESFAHLARLVVNQDSRNRRQAEFLVDGVVGIGTQDVLEISLLIV